MLHFRHHYNNAKDLHLVTECFSSSCLGANMAYVETGLRDNLIICDAFVVKTVYLKWSLSKIQ